VRKRLASLAALAAVAVLVPVAASDAAQNDGSPNDPRAKAFVKEVSVDRVERHQQRLQQIATANGGTRDVFGTGYTASLDYVVRVLENAGYNPQVTPFNFPFWEESQLPVLNRVTPAPPKTYRPGTAEQSGTTDSDFITFGGSPTATLDDVRVVPVGGIVIPSPGGTASGCADTDYTAAVAGAVALIQRGTCPFVQKIQLAVDALPPRCKMIFKLVREDGLRYKEIAGILNISINTIDAQMAIAVKKITAAIGAEFDFPVKKRAGKFPDNQIVE